MYPLRVLSLVPVIFFSFLDWIIYIFKWHGTLWSLLEAFELSIMLHSEISTFVLLLVALQHSQFWVYALEHNKRFVLHFLLNQVILVSWLYTRKIYISDFENWWYSHAAQHKFFFLFFIDLLLVVEQSLQRLQNIRLHY